MGLMAYRLGSTSDSYLHNSPYDVSYDPANYDPTFTGARNSTTKRFRMANPTSAGNFIHYNVALPFYASSNQGNGFCYSTTAQAFNNGENPSSGPWDSYRCYGSKTGSSDTLPTWRNAGSEAARGYGGTWWGEMVFSPTDSDFAQGILDFGRQNTWHYVGRTWYANSSPGRGFLHTPIGLLDAAKATAIKAKLACNVPGAGSPCTNAGIPNAGLTPIEGTLLTARDYFAGTWTNAGEGYTSSCYPLPESCGKNYVILLTDGLPSTDRNGSLVANPASALNAASNAATQLANANVFTYVIGFALPFGTDPNALNQIAAAGGTSTAYNAGDPDSLQSAFDAIFDDIFRREGGEWRLIHRHGNRLEDQYKPATRLKPTE
jgi:type IV pilus assembly protein PilY1